MEKALYGYMIDEEGFVWNKKHTQPLKGKITKDGYRELCLLVDGNNKYIREHRLIAMAFVPNPKPEWYDIVNHKDGNKLNNTPNNLEWTNVEGNTKHAYANKLCSNKKATEAARLVNTNIYEVWKDNQLIGTYKGLKETSAAIGCNEKTITNCIRENRSSRKGYFFIKKGVNCHCDKSAN